MDCDNHKIIYHEDGVDYRIDSDFCEKICNKRYYKNHLITSTYINNIRKKQHSSLAFIFKNLNE